MSGAQAHDLPPPVTRTRLAARAGCDPQTVASWYRGGPMRSTTAARLTEAAQALGVSPPLRAPKVTSPAKVANDTADPDPEAA